MLSVCEGLSHVYVKCMCGFEPCLCYACVGLSHVYVKCVCGFESCLC